MEKKDIIPKIDMFPCLVGRIGIYWGKKYPDIRDVVSMPRRQDRNTSYSNTYIPGTFRFPCLVGRIGISTTAGDNLTNGGVSMPRRQDRNEGIIMALLTMDTCRVSMPRRQDRNLGWRQGYCRSYSVSMPRRQDRNLCLDESCPITLWVVSMPRRQDRNLWLIELGFPPTQVSMPRRQDRNNYLARQIHFALVQFPCLVGRIGILKICLMVISVFICFHASQVGSELCYFRI